MTTHRVNDEGSAVSARLEFRCLSRHWRFRSMGSDFVLLERCCNFEPRLLCRDRTDGKLVELRSYRQERACITGSDPLHLYTRLPSHPNIQRPTQIHRSWPNHDLNSLEYTTYPAGTVSDMVDELVNEHLRVPGKGGTSFLPEAMVWRLLRDVFRGEGFLYEDDLKVVPRLTLDSIFLDYDSVHSTSDMSHLPRAVIGGFRSSKGRRVGGQYRRRQLETFLREMEMVTIRKWKDKCIELLRSRFPLLILQLEVDDVIWPWSDSSPAGRLYCRVGDTLKYLAAAELNVSYPVYSRELEDFFNHSYRLLGIDDDSDCVVELVAWIEKTLPKMSMLEEKMASRGPSECIAIKELLLGRDTVASWIDHVEQQETEVLGGQTSEKERNRRLLAWLEKKSEWEYSLDDQCEALLHAWQRSQGRGAAYRYRGSDSKLRKPDSGDTARVN